MTRPRIAIAGIHIESSTFTPYVSTAVDFTVTRKEDLLARYQWMGTDWAKSVEWVPILHARALPGGVLARDDYETWKEEILDGLQNAGNLDALFFDIHGAMSVQGYDDAEGDLIADIRKVIGNDPLVSASMDLHGNVSQALFDGCDLMTCYRMAPHEDADESRQRAARNLVAAIHQGGSKPAKALVHIPVLLPGEKTSTRLEPAKSLYAMIPTAEARQGVTDLGIWIGFAWADQPRCQAAVVAYGDDAQAVREEAERIAQAFWDARHDFPFVAPVASMDECLDWAKSAPRPTFISDTGDNPGAGVADDVTVALNALLHWDGATNDRLSIIHASIVDPQASRICWQAGVGAEVTLELGGHIDDRHPGPLQVTGTVNALTEDPRGGHTAALAIGTVTVIITEHRNQYTTFEQFERLGLDIRSADVVVVKIGYLEPDLYQAQRAWKMALTPGGVDQDLIRLGHHRIKRPIFPFDPHMQISPLKAQVVTP